MQLGNPPFSVEIDLMQPIDPSRAPKVRWHTTTLFVSMFVRATTNVPRARAHPLVQHGLAPNCFSRTSPQNYTTINKIRGPKVHIPTLNHIGLWVDDIHAAVSELTEAGVRFAPGGIRPGAAGHDVTFIHPKGSADRPLSGEGGWNRNKRQ